MKVKHAIWLLPLVLLSCVSELDVSFPNTVRGNFEALWHTIDTRYCFIDDKGLDWQGVHDVYLPRLDSVKTDRELFDVFASMLDTLHDGHVNLYTPFDVSRSRSWYEGYPSNYYSNIVYGDRYLGSDYKIAGGFHYALIAGDSVGLVRYSSFSSSFSAMNMLYVLNWFRNCKGLVLDVRNNGGGSLENTWRLASVFFSDNRTVGWWQHKTGEGHNDFSRPEPLVVDTADMPCKWLRPVVVLCNRQTYSAANSFVSAMRYADNSCIIGGLSGGGGGMPLSYELPIGWTVRFSSVRMFDAEMRSIENGIEPDISLVQTSTDGRDDLIEEAVKWIMEK